ARRVRRAPAARARARRGDLHRLRRPGPDPGVRPQGRRVLPGGPHAGDRDPLRGRLHGRRVLRVGHGLLRRGADPQGPRHGDRGTRRPHRRGHSRLRPDAVVPDAQPQGPRSPVARGLRAPDQARPAQGRAAGALHRLRDRRPLRDRLRTRSRRALSQPALRRVARAAAGV
ncbi:MAG: Hypoxanthine-guanine phosphoribosyltransferase, partial [uncultured Solirubrobacteraceae bacterium]